jgi:hypothetical protein
MAQPRIILHPIRSRRKHLIAFTLLMVSLLFCARTVMSHPAKVGDFASLGLLARHRSAEEVLPDAEDFVSYASNLAA